MSMGFLTAPQRAMLRAASRLGYCNPFLPDRVEAERAVLGPDFVEGEPVWSYRDPRQGPRENVWRVYRKLEPLLETSRSRLREATAGGPDLVLYEDAVLQFLYTRYYRSFYDAGFGSAAREAGRWR